MVYNNPKMLMLYTNWQKNNVKGEKRMKKYMKQIVSWMCAVLMTLSMAVPVLATNSNAVKKRPSAVEVTFSKNSNTQIELGKEDSVISFDVTFTNPSPGTEVFVKMFLFCFVNDENDKCTFYNWFKDDKPISSETGMFTIPITGKRINDKENISRPIRTYIKGLHHTTRQRTQYWCNEIGQAVIHNKNLQNGRHRAEEGHYNR